MADISAEITAFKNAVYGEDVRDAMVSLANKLNNSIVSGISDITDLVTNQVHYYVGNSGRFLSKLPTIGDPTYYLSWGKPGSLSTNDTLVVLDGVNNITKNFSIRNTSLSTTTFNDVTYINIPSSKMLVYDTDDQELKIINRPTRLATNYHVIAENGYGTWGSLTNTLLTGEYFIDYHSHFYMQGDGKLIVANHYNSNNEFIGWLIASISNSVWSADIAGTFIYKGAAFSCRYITNYLDVVTMNGKDFLFLPKEKMLVFDIYNKKIRPIDYSIESNESWVYALCSTSSNTTFHGELAPYIINVDDIDYGVYFSNAGMGFYYYDTGTDGHWYFAGKDANDDAITLTFKLKLYNNTSDFTSVCSFFDENKWPETYTINGYTWVGCPNSYNVLFNLFTGTFRITSDTAGPGDLCILHSVYHGNSALEPKIQNLFDNCSKIVQQSTNFYIGNNGFLDIKRTGTSNTSSGSQYTFSRSNGLVNSTPIAVLPYFGITSEITTTMLANVATEYSVDDNGVYTYVFASGMQIYYEIMSKTLVRISGNNIRYRASSFVPFLSTQWNNLSQDFGPIGIMYCDSIARKAITSYKILREGALVDKEILQEHASHIDDSQESEMFIFVTDVHTQAYSGRPSLLDQYYYDEANQNGMDLVRAYASQTAVDYIINGGDWINNSMTENQGKTFLGMIDGLNNGFFNKPCYLVAGNHDTNYQDATHAIDPSVYQAIDPDTLRNCWMRDKNNLYYDFMGHDTHYYVLDTWLDWGRANWTDYKKSQIHWLCSKLETEIESHVAILLHIMTIHDNTNNFDYDGGIMASAVINVIQAYNNRTTCSFDGHIYNFTNVQNDSYIEYVFCGHVHEDVNDKIVCNTRNVPIIATTNFAHTAVREFDLVYISYDERRIYCTRVGNGDSRIFDMDTGNLVVS